MIENRISRFIMITRFILQKHILFMGLLFFLSGITREQDANASIVTSLRPLGFIASAIADGITDIQILLPDNASVHNYHLRPSDIRRIQNAELVVWIGKEMEAFMVKPVKYFTKKKQIAISEIAKVNSLLMKSKHDNGYCNHNYKRFCIEKNRKDHHRMGYNMHLWLSPEIAQLSAIAIHDKLVEIMPKNKVQLDANLKDFEEQLAITTMAVSNELAMLKGKGYFVFHDAYKYYEKYYGLTPLGYFTVNPKIHPSVQRLHKIKTQLMQKKAICIFSEPQFNTVFLESVVRGTSVRIGILDPLGTNIQLGKDSYAMFLSQLARQYSACLTSE